MALSSIERALQLTQGMKDYASGAISTSDMGRIFTNTAIGRGTTPAPAPQQTMQAAVQPQMQYVTPQPQQPQQPTGYVPPTGLIGSEQALQGGLQGGLESLYTGFGMAREDLQNALRTGMSALQQGGSVGGPVNINVPSGGAFSSMVSQGMGALQKAGQQGTAALDQSQSQGLAAIQKAIDAGVDPLTGFVDPGRQAQQQQAALSGAMGQEAQQAAFQAFTESPGQAYLREQAERGLLRNQAAIGGLGGGRVREELQRQAMGLAQQDFENQYARLGQLAGQGLTAAGQVGQLRGQQAGLESGLIGTTGQSKASLLGQLAGQQASLAGQMGSAQLGLQGQLAGIQGNLAAQRMAQQAQNQRTAAELASNMGIALAGLGQQGGLTAANLYSGTGNTLAQNRLLTGQQLAANIGGTSTALANLANQYGMSVSDLIGATGGNLSNMLSGTGAQVAQGQQNLGTTLGNIYVGQGSQAASLPGIPGVQQKQSGLQQAAGLAGAAGSLMTGGAGLLDAL